VPILRNGSFGRFPHLDNAEQIFLGQVEKEEGEAEDTEGVFDDAYLKS
jgi:hypothetical protein